MCVLYLHTRGLPRWTGRFEVTPQDTCKRTTRPQNNNTDGQHMEYINQETSAEFFGAVSHTYM